MNQKTRYNLHNIRTGENIPGIDSDEAETITSMNKKNLYSYINRGKPIRQEWLVTYADKSTIIKDSKAIPESVWNEWDRVTGMFRRLKG